MASAVALKLRTVLTPASSRHTASLIFLHGSGDTGDGLRAWLRAVMNTEFSFSHIKVIYPSAPLRPYTPMGGMKSTVWFDRVEISPYVTEDVVSVDTMCRALDELVRREVELGIPHERIMIGGFSMGAALAMHYAYRLPDRTPAGCFALSGFLNDNSVVYQALRAENKSDAPSPEGATVVPHRRPPLYQTHGAEDTLVLPGWATATSTTLGGLGVSTQLKIYPDLEHDMSRAEIHHLSSWIVTRLPQDDATSL